ncbi:MAG: M50 family metallopeptidase [Bacteroidetes bacterium]|nr:M50 family metallopeptidase [Bacteroidota bacterium]
MDKNYILYIIPIVVLIINRTPYIGKYVRVVNTLIHESGHAIAALISRGEVYSVELFSDTSGTAITKTKGKLSQFIVSIAGYPFGSIVAYFMFYLVSIENYKLIFYIITCFAVLNLMFYVRNTFGIFWLISFTILVFAVYFYGGEFMQYAVSAGLSGVILFEAFYSSIELVIIAYKKPKSAGDATNLQYITGIPAILWALLFVAQSAYFIYLSIMLFFIP